MNREDVLTALEAHRPDLARRFGVVSLDLFGSFARGQAREDSDIDLLVRFDGRATPSREQGVQDYLEHLLDRPVDLVPAERLRPEYRAYVEKDIAMDGSGRPVRDWRIPVRDTIRFGERVLARTDGLDFERFVEDSAVYDMAQFNILRMGEAANRIPQDIRDAHPEIDWRGLRGVRNRIAHEYDRVSEDTIWAVVRTAIPVLLPRLRQLLEASE